MYIIHNTIYTYMYTHMHAKLKASGHVRCRAEDGPGRPGFRHFPHSAEHCHRLHRIKTIKRKEKTNRKKENKKSGRQKKKNQFYKSTIQIVTCKLMLAFADLWRIHPQIHPNAQVHKAHRSVNNNVDGDALTWIWSCRPAGTALYGLCLKPPRC